MNVLASGVRYIDLNFQQVPFIATAVLMGPDGVALVDPGPTSCVAALRHGLEQLGIRPADVRTLLLTHIHLDHAGVTGTLVREHPHIRVCVHERGAPHMADPAKLLVSARRLYGEGMDELFGEFEAVPEQNMTVLKGGERIEAAGRTLEVLYTPGHAWHHVSYFDASSGVAWVGDTCGARVGPSSWLSAPTPPPDIELDAWNRSLDAILAWVPKTLFLTHFGPAEDPEAHVAELRTRLTWMAELAREALTRHPSSSDPSSQAAAVAFFQQELSLELRRHMSAVDAASYDLVIPPEHNFLGLSGSWRKQAEKALKG